MKGEILAYTGVISQVFYHVYSEQGPLLNVGSFVSVQAKVLDGSIVHISLHNPKTGAIVWQQIIATKEQLLSWVKPLDTNMAKVLYE